MSQAELVKSVNPDAKVWVYRNLVKALPWYSSVREKLLDPAYAGFFLKFDAKNSTPYHVPQCSASTVGNKDKCSKFYHDQEQTPQNGPSHLGPIKTPDGWTVWQPYNGCGGGMVHCDAANQSASCQVWQAPKTVDWQACSRAADIAMQTNPLIRIFTWWPDSNSKTGLGACWLTKAKYAGIGGPEKNHVMGYKGPASATPDIPSSSYNTCLGDCDCGPGLPCGEYLWDHRNGSMLEDFLINDFVLNPRTGLRNPNIDGFYFDDGWTNKPSPVPPWAPPTYKQCNMWKTGGATEEDYYCIEDMGLSQGDVDAITAGHAALMGKVADAILSNDGFGWPYLTPRIGGLPSLDLNDPRPTCAKHLREGCAGAYLNETLMFEFTRKTFHDAFPLPFVTQDLAQFLLVRGPYAYLGYSWMGCVQPSGFVTGNSTKGYFRPPEVDVDYGAPVDATCAETAPNSGIFTREWSKASVEMDCNTWSATITMKGE